MRTSTTLIQNWTKYRKRTHKLQSGRIIDTKEHISILFMRPIIITLIPKPKPVIKREIEQQQVSLINMMPKLSTGGSHL
jgi:hypothetical protein